MSLTFSPSDLIPVKSLCATGTIPLSYDRARVLARAGTLPAIKWRGQWHTTKTLATRFFYRGANKSFRRAVA